MSLVSSNDIITEGTTLISNEITTKVMRLISNSIIFEGTSLSIVKVCTIFCPDVYDFCHITEELFGLSEEEKREIYEGVGYKEAQNPQRMPKEVGTYL